MAARRVQELISGIEELEADLLPEKAIVANARPGSGVDWLWSQGLAAGACGAVTDQHAWGVRKRLAFAREPEPFLAEGGEGGRSWSHALPAIRSAYPGLELNPPVGLLPL